MGCELAIIHIQFLLVWIVYGSGAVLANGAPTTRHRSRASCSYPLVWILWVQAVVHRPMVMDLHMEDDNHAKGFKPLDGTAAPYRDWRRRFLLTHASAKDGMRALNGVKLLRWLIGKASSAFEKVDPETLGDQGAQGFHGFLAAFASSVWVASENLPV